MSAEAIDCLSRDEIEARLSSGPQAHAAVEQHLAVDRLRFRHSGFRAGADQGGAGLRTGRQARFDLVARKAVDRLGTHCSLTLTVPKIVRPGAIAA